MVPRQVSDAVAKIRDAAHRAGKKSGIFATGPEQARQFAEQGFDFISVATDYTALESTPNEAFAVATGASAPEKGKSY